MFKRGNGDFLEFVLNKNTNFLLLLLRIPYVILPNNVLWSWIWSRFLFGKHLFYWYVRMFGFDWINIWDEVNCRVFSLCMFESKLCWRWKIKNQYCDNNISSFEMWNISQNTVRYLVDTHRNIVRTIIQNIQT